MSPSAETWLSNYRATQFINFDGTLQVNGKNVKQPTLTSNEIAEVRRALGMAPLCDYNS